VAVVRRLPARRLRPRGVAGLEGRGGDCCGCWLCGVALAQAERPRQQRPVGQRRARREAGEAVSSAAAAHPERPPPAVPFGEPVMFIRIVTGITSHFPERVIEWIMGVTLIWWGSKLVGPADAWSNPAAWQGMLMWMSEDAWGWNCTGLGVARLLALAINGTFADTLYSRFSPLVRGVSAG
jgi:hypothetical protein